MFKQVIAACVCLLLPGIRILSQEPASSVPSLLNKPDFFPLAVWLQDPRNAARYREIGINLYVGLWKGPTASQLAALEDATMPVICGQNELALQDLNRQVIIGWMHDDEPDNAQPLGSGRGYGPPVPPEKVVAEYRRWKQADPSRPVLLNLGQGVAWDRWHGRGVRTNKPEDYPLYLQGCDIASFDIYPVTHSSPEVAGRLEFVARGVQRLRQWSAGSKPVWACIECTRISNPDRKPTPDQVRSMVWMALVHGANGLIYFCHEFKPRFVEAGLLADTEMASAVRAINAQIRSLAPVLNSPTVEGAVRAASGNASVPVDVLVKRTSEATYVFAIAMRNEPTRATFSVEGLQEPAKVEVLGEGRTIPGDRKGFEDAFQGYQAHLYRIPNRR